MEISNLIPHIEALIFASDKPLTAMEITELINNAFGFMEDKITLDQIESALQGTIEKYRSEFYPFEVRESGGGWQFLTKKEFHKTVGQLNGDKFLKRLSTAALEALSIIAYKQPVTKAEIEAIRGVSSDYAIQKLLEKELIVITGRNEKLPGHPLVYATSKTFMDYFGLNSPEDLPKLKEVFDESALTPTIITEGTTVQPTEEGEVAEEAVGLAVSENGSLVEGLTVDPETGEVIAEAEESIEETTTEEVVNEEEEEQSPADETAEIREDFKEETPEEYEEEGAGDELTEDEEEEAAEDNDSEEDNNKQDEEDK
ncbi:MAG: SMC-Scp complex subunit ScpB [Chitinophagaceae bacterium]